MLCQCLQCAQPPTPVVGSFPGRVDQPPHTVMTGYDPELGWSDPSWGGPSWTGWDWGELLIEYEMKIIACDTCVVSNTCGP